MPNAKGAATTRVSSRGQVMLPRAVRERRAWSSGTRLLVEETADGVLLRPAPLFAPTRLDDVAGMLRYDGPTITVEQMNESILEEAARRHARGRY